MDYLNITLDKNQIISKSTLSLAFLGDSVFELMVRARLCASTELSNRDLHRETQRFVSAEAQAAAFERIRGLLTEEESAVFLRGRNAQVHTIPRHAKRADYQAATGFEALVGYLYLLGRKERLCTLFEAMLSGT